MQILRGHDAPVLCANVLSTGKIISGDALGILKIWGDKQPSLEIEPGSILQARM